MIDALCCAGGFLWTCGFVLVLCILFGSFIEDNVFWVVISGAGALLFAAYLLFDLQKLMGGRYLAVHPDDYVYAAVQARACMQFPSHVNNVSSAEMQWVATYRRL